GGRGWAGCEWEQEVRSMEPLVAAAGRASRHQKEQRQAVAGVQQKAEGYGIHEGDVGEVQLPPNGCPGVVGPAEWNPGAGGGKLTQEGGNPSNNKEQASTAPAQEPSSGEE